MNIMKLKENKAKSLIETAINELIVSIEKGQSEVLTNYLQAMGRFHHYSFTNIMLISRQFPNATRVAGFQTWKKLDRFVIKGEKGIKIIAPMISKKESLKDKNEEDEVYGFRIVNVFDIRQTKGTELPEISTVKGDPTEYSERLNQLIADQKIELLYASNVPADGYSTGGCIVIRTGLSPAEDFSVRIHELAHEMLHQSDKEKLSTEQKETEAEAVAFVVCDAIGLDTNSACRDYIQMYTGDKEMLLKSFERIQKTSSEILYKIKSITHKIES